MKIPKTVLVLLIGTLLVMSSGFIFLSTRSEGEQTAFSDKSGPVSRSRVSKLVEEEELIPTVLLERDRALGLLGEGETGFVSKDGESGQPIVILCPGHRDYVKNAVGLLSNHQDWIKVE